MNELKYPPGVRFIFLLALSIFSGLLLLSLDGPAGERQMPLFYGVALLLSLPLFVISVLPWAKNCRKRTFFFGLALLFFSTYFLFFDEVRERVEWFYFLPAFALSCFMIYHTRFVSVPNQQSRALRGFGYGFFVFALLMTPILTVVTIGFVENRMKEMILLAPVWFLIFGVILKLLGIGKNNLRPNKLLTYSGECSIVLSFPMLMFIAMEWYGIAIIVSFLFALCFVCINGLKARLMKIADENSPLPPLVAGSYRKPAKPTMWAENHGGSVLIVAFLALGLIGFILGAFVSNPNDYMEPDIGGLRGGLIGMMSAIMFPVSVILFPVILLFIGAYIVLEAILRTRRYGYLWFGLVLLAIASPFLLMAGHVATNFLFAESEPQLEQLTDSEYYVDIEYLDELIGVDEDGDGWDAYDELITDRSDHGPDNTPSEDEVAVASKKLEELGWEEFKVTLTNNTSMVSAIKGEEQPFLDNDTEIWSGPMGGEPGNPPGMGGSPYGMMNPMVMRMGGAPERFQFTEPGHDPSNLAGNYGFKKIHLAVMRADMEDIKAQIMAGADINAPDEVGNTPLHFALALGETEIAEWLISQDVDLEAKANDGRTMTHAAAAGGQIELLKKLAVGPLKLDAKNALMQTPLHLAVAAGQTETVEWLLEQDQKVSVQDVNNNTPLHMAVIYCRAGLAKRLVEWGADLKAFNRSGQAAIHLACSTGQLGLVYWMLQQDEALVNLPDGGRFTPLYHAAINGNRRTASLLLSKKAKIQAGDNAELSDLFSKVLNEDREYFDRFKPPMNSFGGMGMNPMMMGMPGMGMPGMGMPGMGMPGMGMPGMDSDQLADLIGVDQDGDGWDAYDEVITDHSDDDPNDTPSEQELEDALVKLNELGWDEYKGTLSKITAILTGKTEEAEENKYEVFDDDLIGVDEDADGWDAWDEKITGHSDNDPADKPEGQEEVDKAQADLNTEAEEKAISDYEDAIASQTLQGIDPNPEGIGMPSDMSGAWPSGTIEIEEPKPEEREALRQVDANGNSLLHLAAAIGDLGLVSSIVDVEGLSKEAKNKMGLTPVDIAQALDRPVFPEPSDDFFGMGMLGGIMGMPGMPPMGGEPGNPVGMMGGSPYGMMNPMMMGMYGMGGMGMMGMDTNKIEKISDVPPLKEPVDLFLIEWDKTQISLSDRYSDPFEEREESDDDLIGVDEDEDGYDAYDEKLTGHSDNDPDDKPTDEELDAAYALEEEGLDPMELPPPPVEMAEPSISTSVSEMEDEAQNGVDAYYEVVTQAKDELGLRKITENRIANANRVRSYFESVAVGPVAQWQRQNITGLFNEATDPRLGFSAIKWMEMLNFNLKVNDFSIANPKDEAFQRLRFRNSSELGSEGGPLIHEFIKTDSEYELAFLLSQNLNIDQQDSRGRTALHIAAANGQLATVKQLLFGGANHEIADDYGFSALHWAAQNGQLEVVHYLVEKVKVKSGKDRFNRDPAALAKANGHTIVSDYLKSKN